MKKIKLFNNDIDLLILSEDKYIIKEQSDLNLKIIYLTKKN